VKKLDSYYKVRNINDIKDLLTQSAELYGTKIAYKIKDKDTQKYNSVTYSKLKKDVDSLGTSLINLGLKGKKIAVIGENSYEWVISYLATICGTGIVVPLDKMLPENEIKNLIKRAEISAIVFSDKFSESMKSIKSENLGIEYFINMNKKTEDFTYLYDLVEEGNSLINEGNKEFINASINNNEMSVILFTSGTTSMAKAVMLSHKNICSDIMSTRMTVKITPKDVALSFLPIHHTYECTLGFLTLIYSGGTIVFCEGLRHIVKNLQESKATVMVCVPLLFENMYKKIWAEVDKKNKRKLVEKAIKVSNFLRKYLKINVTKLLFKDIYSNFGGKIRLFICGAAAIEPSVATGFNDFGITLLQGYGLTECSPLLVGCSDRHKAFGTCGYPIPNVEIKIIDKDKDGVGEIIAKGPNVMLGYYQNEEATKEVLKDGWFYTGDLGYLDDKGRLIITGRKKNVIVLKNGKNVFPEELESLLNKDEIIKESFVFGKEDTDGDTVIWAKIVANYEALKEKFGELTDIQIKDKIQEVIKKINKKMPQYKYIKKFKISSKELIKTTTQKIKRHEEIKEIEKEEKNEQ